MLISDDEVPELKKWIIKKLEDISDADSEVLADYVLALIRIDLPTVQLRKNATENLEDFLRNNTVKFVDELLQVAKFKSYLQSSSYSVAAPQVSAHPNTFSSIPTFQTAPLNSRKRAYNAEQGSVERHASHYEQDTRGLKQARSTFIANERGGLRRSYDRAHAPNLTFAPTTPDLHFNRTDPSGSMMALQMMGMPVPAFPGDSHVPFPNPQAILGQGLTRQAGSNTRCWAYDTKGICHRGIRCPFIHEAGAISIAANEVHDLKSPFMVDMPFNQLYDGHTVPDEAGQIHTNHSLPNGSSRQGRASFSQAAPNFDRAKTSIVVEQIPEQSFSEEQVQEFFSAFGQIEKITMQPYKRLTVIRYADYIAAKAAYESPKAVFDNRFVKVYWYNPDGVQERTKSRAEADSALPHDQPAEPVFDHEKFAKDSEAAQKRLEERKALKADTDAKLADLAKQQETLAERHAEERQKLNDVLKAKGKLHASDTNGKKDDDAATEVLRAQLRALEEEAKSLGIDPEPWASYGRGRGRGHFRGQDHFSGVRGSGSYRAGVRGRGSFRPGYAGRGRGAGYNVSAFNLDNRPKKVRARGVDFDTAKDEALRQHITTIGDFVSISLDKVDAGDEHPSSVTVAFKDRATAEMFFYGPRNIHGVGRLELSWVKEPLFPPTSTNGTSGNVSIEGAGNEDQDHVMKDAGLHRDDSKVEIEAEEATVDEGHGGSREVDYDVAEDDDRWG